MSSEDPSRAGPITRLMEAGEGVAGRTLAALRPRVSLTSGSVMVLVTLLLPIGYESCGPETKGYELVQGHGGWPTFLGIALDEYFGPPFYAILLAFALVTLILALVSFGKPALWQNRWLCRRTFLLSGALSLFLLADVTALLPMGAEEWGALSLALIIVSGLAPMCFWPRRILERWLGPLILAGLAAWVSTRLNLIYGDVSSGFMVGIWLIYGLGPLAIWLGMVSGRFGENRRAIRRGLIAFYFPVAVGNIWFYQVAWREGIEGFVPCSLGLFLMTLGYMRLAKEAEARPSAHPRASDTMDVAA
jgi:hypothetical protein